MSGDPEFLLRSLSFPLGSDATSELRGTKSEGHSKFKMTDTEVFYGYSKLPDQNSLKNLSTSQVFCLPLFFHQI